VTDTYPRQKAATRNFQLGAPRSFQISESGNFVTFLRSDHGRDAVNSLLVYDLAKNLERKIADPKELLTSSEEVPAAEKARRERMREMTSGITAYSTDSDGTKVCFALSGLLFVVDLNSGTSTELSVTGPIIDPQLSPNGNHIAWTTGKDLLICNIDGTSEKNLTNESQKDCAWGLVDFVAAEELGRMRGFWWAPDSNSILVEKFDNSEVPTWWISDPTNPQSEPQEHKYPASGTTNPVIELYLTDLVGKKTKIEWDRTAYEYLVSISWQKKHNALVTVSNRAQTEFQTFELVSGSLEIKIKHEDSKFIDVIPGQPRWIDQDLLTVVDDSSSDTREIQISGNTLSPKDLQVMAVTGTTKDQIYFVGTTNAIDRDLYQISNNGDLVQLTNGGVNSSSAPVESDSGTLIVLASSQIHEMKREFSLLKDGKPIHIFDNLAEHPLIQPEVHNLQTGPHQVNTAVLFPTGHKFGSEKLPVIMRPYGGPHGAQVLNGALVYVEDQWFADQGFVVIVADNRGTPARGPKWDRSIHKNFVQPVLDDQIAALKDVANHYPNDVDISRVGITGWSFGGYLSALAVLDAPEYFHAAVAGAPVTDWKLYDTAYTERYLGHPDENEEVYKAHSLIEKAYKLSRPLLLVHGLADDNVVAAHSLKLSAELLAHKRNHEFLPLAGVTHMTPQEVITENLMLKTIEFFKENL
jgi:dipeptidyl-peptidase-4